SSLPARPPRPPLFPYTTLFRSPDSVRVSDAAIKQAREYINAQFDKRYLPDEPNVYKGGRGSKVQDAHEAIRPTEVGLRPDDLKKYLERDLFKLYQLIWRRFVASQMNPVH